MTQELYVNVYRSKPKGWTDTSCHFKTYENACQDILDSEKYYEYICTLTNNGRVYITKEDLIASSPTYAAMVLAEDKAQQKIDEERGK